MAGEGPFLWLTKGGPPAGFSSLPPGGMCLSVFLFVQQGGNILLGRYADDPHWETLTGLDAARRRRHGSGWTIPASHLKFGEDPRDAARRLGEQVLQLPGLTYGEPRVEVDLYEPARAPGQPHFDVWFLVDAFPPQDFFHEKPPWYADLGWFDPRTTPPTMYARGHEDVVARWLQPPGQARPVLRTA